MTKPELGAKGLCARCSARFYDPNGAENRLRCTQTKQSENSIAPASFTPVTRAALTGLCRHSNQSLFASVNSAGKKFGEARDQGAIFGDTGQFRATETALSCLFGAKVTESQRLFRRRQETAFARSVTRSQFNSRTCRVAKLPTLPPRSTTSAPESAARFP